MSPLHYRDNHADNMAILRSVDVYVSFPGQYWALPFKKTRDGSYAFCAVSNFEAFPGNFVFENIMFVLGPFAQKWFKFNPIPPGLFLEFLGLGGGGGGFKSPPPLHKSESVNAIVMKLGG